jgi:hypothetical protein
MGFFTGSKAKNYQQSTLLPQQQGAFNQLQGASKGQGAGGAFGQAADYYRDLLSDDSQTFNAMQAPEQRRFQEDIIPGLSEQFAGMGSGGLSSSGFRNAAVNAGTDLSERLGAIRANLRQQGAAGLANIGQQSLGSYSENIHQPGTGGFLDTIAPAIGGALGSFAGPLGTAAGGALGSALGGAFGGASSKGQSSPFGNPPQTGGGSQSKFGLPNFLNQ